MVGASADEEISEEELWEALTATVTAIRDDTHDLARRLDEHAFCLRSSHATVG
jgi:hypothetical protein